VGTAFYRRFEKEGRSLLADVVCRSLLLFLLRRKNDNRKKLVFSGLYVLLCFAEPEGKQQN
jgi:hypothetical protein